MVDAKSGPLLDGTSLLWYFCCLKTVVLLILRKLTRLLYRKNLTMEYLPAILVVIFFFVSILFEKVRVLNHYKTKLFLSAIALIILIYLVFIKNEREFYALAFWSFLFIVFILQGIMKKLKKGQNQFFNS